MLFGTGRYLQRPKKLVTGLAGWMLAPSDASTNRTLPGWQGRMLAPSDTSRNRTLPGRQGRMLAPLMLLGTGRCQVGRHGCSPHQVLLETGRYHVQQDGAIDASKTGRCQAGSEASRNRTLQVGRDRWPLGVPDITGKAGMRLQASLPLLGYRRVFLFPNVVVEGPKPAKLLAELPIQGKVRS